MKHLTPTEASRIMFALLQKVRTSTEGGAKLTLANASTLFATLKNPGALQSDIYKEVGGVADSAISRHFDVLEGRGRSEDGPSEGLILRVRDPRSRTNNAVTVTDAGQAFAQEFADHLNKLLASADK